MKRFSSILVTTDFSEASKTALAVARELGERLGSKVTLLTVVADTLPPLVPGLSAQGRAETLEEMRREAAAHLEQLAATELPDARTAAILGNPAREIAEHAAENGHDLIVMASHDHGPLAQILLGSTTERTLHRAPCPVLVVRTADTLKRDSGSRAI